MVQTPCNSCKVLAMVWPLYWTLTDGKSGFVNAVAGAKVGVENAVSVGVGNVTTLEDREQTRQSKRPTKSKISKIQQQWRKYISFFF